MAQDWLWSNDTDDYLGGLADWETPVSRASWNFEAPTGQYVYDLGTLASGVGAADDIFDYGAWNPPTTVATPAWTPSPATPAPSATNGADALPPENYVMARPEPTIAEQAAEITARPKNAPLGSPPKMPGQPDADKGVVRKVLEKIGDNPGKTAQAIMGLGSLAAIAKGLTGDRQPKAARSPETREALDALRQARARASGSPAQRGYGGEEQIRQEVNAQTLAALKGGDDFVPPELVRRRDDDLRVLHDRLRTELGPGYATSTAGLNALENRGRMWEELFEQVREQRLASRNTMALQRTGVARQLEMDPATLAQAELGILANADANAAATAAAERQGLLGLGGQLAGYAVAPYVMQSYRDLYEPRPRG